MPKKIIIINHRDSENTRKAKSLWQKFKTNFKKYGILIVATLSGLVILYFAIVISLFLLILLFIAGLSYFVYLKLQK